MKNIPPLLVLAVHPPSKIEEQFQKDPLQKAHVSRKRGVFLPTGPPIDLKKAPSRPGVHRRVHIPKRPLVGGDLAIGMHTPDAGEEQELRFGKLRVEVGKGHTMEGEIPSRKPRILPLIRHRNDLCNIEMPPVAVKFTAPSEMMSPTAIITNPVAPFNVTIPVPVVVTELFKAIVPPVTTFKPVAVL